MNQSEGSDPREAGFDPGAWHDRAVWGMEWRTGEGGDDWTSQFVLRFDSIVRVYRENDVVYHEVAPAQLVFEDVTDLRIGVDAGSVQDLPSNAR